MAPANLSDMTHWSHRLLAEVLHPGDLAVDLTAGRGHDTLWLAEQVQSNQSGCVVAFDIQSAALQSCRELLAQQNYRHGVTDPSQLQDSGIHLIHGCHSQPWRLPRAPQAVLANFGYLPGGDHAITTTPDTTCQAVQQACDLVTPGGRIVLVLYTGHPGAAEECQTIESLCQSLAPRHWHVMRLQPVNRHQAPYLLLLEKRRLSPHQQCSSA